MQLPGLGCGPLKQPGVLCRCYGDRNVESRSRQFGNLTTPFITADKMKEYALFNTEAIYSMTGYPLKVSLYGNPAKLEKCRWEVLLEALAAGSWGPGGVGGGGGCPQGPRHGGPGYWPLEMGHGGRGCPQGPRRGCRVLLPAPPPAGWTE
jgi:hypothetical protein